MVVQLDDAKIRVKLDIQKLEGDLDKADTKREKRKEKRRGILDREKRKKLGQTVIVPASAFGFLGGKLGKTGLTAGMAVLAAEMAERYIFPMILQMMKKSDSWFWQIMGEQIEYSMGKGSDFLDMILDEAELHLQKAILPELGLDKSAAKDIRAVVEQMRDAGFLGTAKTLVGVLGDMKRYTENAALLGRLPGIERLGEIGLGTAKIRLAEEEMQKALQQRATIRLTDQLMKYINRR